MAQIKNSADDGTCFGWSVLCYECREDLLGTPSTKIHENVVREVDGSIDYIELAHKECVA